MDPQLDVDFPGGPAIGASPSLARQRRTRRLEVIAVLLLLLAAGIAHGLNMENFPYYEDDEGTYVSQAWAVIREGQLAPYYYIYDHPPAGWLQIAGWFDLTGGMHTFGTVVESGRVMMLVMQVGSTLMVYLIARQLTRRPWAALLSALAFSLSAFGIYYHRRVLLDNIATFWMLASLVLLVYPRPRLLRFVLSGLAMAVSILSKEVLAAVGPALLVFAITRAEADARLRSTVAWVVSAGVIVSLYPLYAFRRGELFPGGPTGISLIGTLEQQAARGHDGGLLSLSSSFWGNLRQWAAYAPMLVVAGTVAAFVLIAVIRWRPSMAAIGLATISYWAFLGRGGATIIFYVLPLLPLLALDLGLAVGLADEAVSRLAPRLGRAFASGAALHRGLIGVATLGAVVGVVAGYTSGNPQFHGNPLSLWQGTEAVGQRQAIQWVLDNVPPNARIIIDMYMWADLHEVPPGKQPFTAAEYYWKVDLDPTIRNGVFKDNWRNVQWVIASPQVLFDATHQSSLVIVREALSHSTVVTTIGSGWPVQMRKVTP